MRLPFGELQRLLEAALLRSGFDSAGAAAISVTMAAAERDGVRSHGLLRLPGFMHSVAIGWADGRARPVIVERSGSLLVIDACNGFAQVALGMARETIALMARSQGVATLLIRNSHHFAALWPDIEDFAAAGLVALTCVNSKRRMAAWGGGHPVTGTNAMAFACPRTGAPPLVWDQSSSVLSQGDVLLAAAEGREVPVGVGCDAEGRPTTSPAAILNGGALLPFGGHKGASLAVMVEILAAALTGAPFGFEDRSPGTTATTSLGGQFLLLIDPARANREFSNRVSVLIGALHEAGATRLPGERRHEFRKLSLAEGINLSLTEHVTLLRHAGA